MQAFSGVAGKLAYQQVEIARFIERHDLPFQFNPHFPVMTIGVMRGAAYAQGKDWESDYINAVFDALWVQGAKMDDPDVIAQVLTDAGLPTADIMAATQTPEVKQALIDTTSAAVDRGVFGAPTMFVGDEMFFGKDSLTDLEWRLTT
ncbi:MAG: 2-hydroxychromene-2-carboxylate isomerase, partial [Paracoccaceae bacterium]